MLTMANNLYYSDYIYLVGSLTVRPLHGSWAGAAGAAAPPEGFCRFAFGVVVAEALCLPVWEVGIDFWVFWSAFQAAAEAAFSAFSFSHSSRFAAVATRLSSLSFLLYKELAALSCFI
jgi:hypothetical protein